jgi:hypothetical protein
MGLTGIVCPEGRSLRGITFFADFDSDVEPDLMDPLETGS